MAFTIDGTDGLTFNDSSTQSKSAATGQTGAAPFFTARAWVNFNGTGTVAIRASGNVSSITDNANGDYTVNFTTAMPDANYSANLSGLGANTGNLTGAYVIKGTQGTGATLKSTTQLNIQTGSSSGASVFDTADINVAIFR